MARTQTTIRIEEELLSELDTEAEELGISRSEYIRDILHERHKSDELQGEIDSLRERLESRENRIEELEGELARRSQIEDKVEEVALQVREDREDRNAPFFVKWYRWFKDSD